MGIGKEQSELIKKLHLKTKEVSCRYCGLVFSTPLMTKKANRMCKSCGTLYIRFAKKRTDGEMGNNFTIHDFIFWYLKQPKICAECGSKENITVDRIKADSLGGKYELGNIQLLCYTCNCCLKRSFSSVKEAQQIITENKCKNCNKIFPLTTEFWYKKGKGTEPKYLKQSLSFFHNICKACILIQRHNHYLANKNV